MELEISRPETEIATRKRQTSLRRKESFTKKGSKMIIQDCNIMLWRRERALLKLLLCEEDLLSSIAQGRDRFIVTLRKQHTLITPMEMNILFGNIEEVAAVYEKCVQQLRQMTQGNEDGIGRLYQKQLDDRFSVLRTYIYGLHLSKTLLNYKMSNTPFREFLEGQEKKEEPMEIVKLLEKPIQYIADVTLQLETLLSCTAIGHRDYVCHESVVSAFQSFSREMAEIVNKLERFVDTESIKSAFDEQEPYIALETLQEKTIFTKGPKSFSLVHPGRYWLFSGELSKIEGRHYVQYWALLLSDCLILTRRTDQRVLLVLDEPVMLRTIYQASFDVQKCDTEFRILFALENPQKSTGQRNRWLTWILRTPTVGVKLIWQTILTYQLSFYSTEALNAGTKASFVHARPLPGLKPISIKKNPKYEESSFVTLAEELNFQNTNPGTSKHLESLALKEFTGQQPKANKFILPISKRTDILKEISARKSKERSYFSLNENVISPDNVDTDAHQTFPRSISFGNEFRDTIPFIDDGGTEITSLDTAGEQTTKPTTDSNLKTDNCPKDGEDQHLSAPDTPLRSDKCIQTDCTAESPTKRTPKKRFPRLGTFERIKIDKKNNSEPSTPSQFSPNHTQTGTSFRHRRPMKVTTSKELLLKSAVVSPSKDEPDGVDILPDMSADDKKKPRSLFSRLFRRDSKAQEHKSVKVTLEELKIVNNADEAAAIEKPPDYEVAVQSAESPWPEQNCVNAE